MQNPVRFRILTYIICVVLASGLVLSLSGCSTGETSKTSGNIPTASASRFTYGKTVIAYAGGTCEAPTFAALDKGFFKEEGLDVELIKMGFEQLKTGLTAGKVDAAQSNIAWLKPIEQGMNIKLTAGIHTGCIKAVTPADSGIKTIADLKGKAVGVDAIGGGPMIALSIKLKEVGLNPQTDVQWKAYPGPQLDQAITNGEIQAYMTWDPFPTMAHDSNNYVTLLDIGTDDPFKDVYCCFVGINGDLVKDNPAKAAAITRALLKASEWVGQNPQEAAQIEIDNKYIGGDLALNAKLLGEYTWHPGVKQAQENIKYLIKELKSQNILETATNEDDLYQRIFADVIPDFRGN